MWMLCYLLLSTSDLLHLSASFLSPFNLPHYISHSTSPWLPLINLLCSCPVLFLHMLPAEQGDNYTSPSLLFCATCLMWETPKFAQIFRPSMVASKLRRHQLGIGFGEDAAVHDENKNDAVVRYRVFASTWNVGGVAPSDDLDLQDWLDTRASSYDIYVLGFQEIVPLNARNVLGPKNSSVSSKWNKLIGDALNSTGRSSVCLRHEQQQFRCVMSKQMVGIFVTVWARSGLRRHVRHPGVSSVGAGVLGRLGNKGAVSVRFLLHGTSFCFVCCHLASGSKDGDVLLRNVDAADILTRTTFRSSGCGGGTAAPDELLPKKILDHDLVVLLGDLNYRISMDDAEARLLVSAKKWSMLLENDELLLELSNCGRFDGWSEGLVTFSPTYKYHLNSDEFYWCTDVAGGLQKQQRAPAWCDRLLWRGKGLRQIRYESCGGYRLSDHRPVRAVFEAVCEVTGVVDPFPEGFCALR